MGESAKKSDLFHFEANTRLVKVLKIGGEEVPNLYYWCKIPPQSLIFPYCALNQRNPLGELASIKGEINFPLDWLTVQKAKLTWQSELDDSLSSQQSYSVQGKVDNKVNCIGGN